jgi:O-antigen ligase
VPARIDNIAPIAPEAAAIRKPPAAERKVSFWLLGYIALLPYQYAVIHDARVGIADACLFGYLIFNVSRIRLRTEAWRVWHFALLLLFAVGLLVSALREGAVTPYQYLNKGFGLLTLFAAYAMITSEVESWGQLRRAMRVFVLGVTVQNVVALAALLASYVAKMQFSFINYDNERLSGFLYDPNAYGGLLVVALAFNLVGSAGSVPVTRGWLRLFCNMTLALGIVFTFSRSAWMALAATWLVYLVLQPKLAAKTLGIVAAGLPVLVAMIGLGLLSPKRMLDRPDTIQQRVGLINDSLAQFEKHPVFGMGLGEFRAAEGLIVHNTPLWFLADFGLVGLGVFMGFVGWFLVAGFKAYLAAPQDGKAYVVGLLAAYCGMLGLSMGIEGFYQRHWWLCFALIAAAATVARKAPAAIPRPAAGGMRARTWWPAAAAYGRHQS